MGLRNVALDINVIENAWTVMKHNLNNINLKPRKFIELEEVLQIKYQYRNSYVPRKTDWN